MLAPGALFKKLGSGPLGDATYQNKCVSGKRSEHCGLGRHTYFFLAF